MRKGKNILFIPSWYPSPERPFLGNFIQNQVDLIAETNSVYVINTVLSNDERSRVVTHQQGNITEYTVYITAKNKLTRLLQEKKTLNKLFNEIPEIDLVIGAVLFQKGYQFVWAKKHFKVPLLLIEHSSVYHTKNWSKTQQIIFKKTKAHIDSIVAVSETLKGDLNHFFSEKPIQVIGNHIDTQVFSAKEKTKNKTTQLLHISTLADETKNPELLFKTIEQLAATYSDFHLTVICDEDFSVWQSYCEHHGFGEFLTFIGATKQEEIVHYYNKADIFILTSPYETFSIVLLEAWATQTPTISFEVGVNAPFQENFGLQIEKNDPIQLSKQITELIQDTKEFNREGMSDFAYQFSKEAIAYQWNETIDRYAE